MTAEVNKRPAAIRLVLPFVFRHWLNQPAGAPFFQFNRAKNKIHRRYAQYRGNQQPATDLGQRPVAILAPRFTCRGGTRLPEKLRFWLDQHARFRRRQAGVILAAFLDRPEGRRESSGTPAIRIPYRTSERAVVPAPALDRISERRRRR